MSNTFAVGQFDEGVFARFVKLIAQQDSYMRVFNALAIKEHQNFYSTTMRGKSVDEVARMRQIAIDKSADGDFGVDATYWFQTITAKINQLKQVEDFLAAELDAQAETLSNSSSRTFWLTATMVGCVLLVTILLGITVARSIYVPLNKVVKLTEKMNNEFAGFETVVEAIAANDLTQQLNQTEMEQIGINTKDEVGELVASVEATLGAKDRMGSSLTKMLENLNSMVLQLTDNARELGSAATEIASTSEEMSRGSTDQAQQVAQVSTAIEQMSATIVESSRNAGEATEASRGASDTATSGGQLVNETIQGMQKISDVVRESSESIGRLAKSADQIGEIVGVIDDIADQTNLLALNAAIEAARAGEQGRGFAVVADEVRKLAERTGKATGEITDMIKGIQTETEEAVQSMETGVTEVDKGRELADNAGNSLTEIVNMSQRVMDMIQQIATATDEQSTAAEEISKNVENVASVTKETATGAEQAAAAAEQMNKNAEGLQQIVAQFKVTSAS
ncbi:MAG: methyl-accepting chemotaxis protein [candidate division Zixibacteria bacterium]|nr:methyl-accepting chemotaxis protein [candidate division Zixibacteria bacterium]